MLGKLYHTAAIVSIAIVLAAGALVGVLFGSGKLTVEQIETIAQMIRGDSDQAQEDETAEADGQGAAAEATQAPSADEIHQQRRDDQLRRALTERAYRDLIAQRELLDRALQELVVGEERFNEKKATWTTELEQRRGATRNAGFEKELQYVGKLPPKQAKEHLVLKWNKRPANAVHLLAALPTSTGKRILEQLKSPDEIRIMHELLERLSQESVDEVADGSGRTAGN